MEKEEVFVKENFDMVLAEFVFEKSC